MWFIHVKLPLFPFWTSSMCSCHNHNLHVWIADSRKNDIISLFYKLTKVLWWLQSKTKVTFVVIEIVFFGILWNMWLSVALKIVEVCHWETIFLGVFTFKYQLLAINKHVTVMLFSMWYKQMVDFAIKRNLLNIIYHVCEFVCEFIHSQFFLLFLAAPL